MKIFPSLYVMSNILKITGEIDMNSVIHTEFDDCCVYITAVLSNRLNIIIKMSKHFTALQGLTVSKQLTVVGLGQVLVMGLAQVGVRQVGVRQVRDVGVCQRVGQPPSVAAATALRGRGGGGGGAQVGGAQLGGATHPVLHA